ncbi:MAG: division/cell wall cluster transcriptional repressor MraZ [Candidatus Omnitrophica bacterium]|nr:division/cell wall cluster transcriptional repressor MraZ [Candidatus Omnitrophota bacterium]
MWYGEYNHTLDEKDRFILPAKFREKIKSFKRKKFYVTRGLEGCLFMFHQDVWRTLEEKLKTLSFTKQQSRSFNRLYFSGACEITVDSQGRVAIPEYLKTYADMYRDVVIIGVADRIEVWSKKRWSTFFTENSKKFEDVAEDLF